MNEGELTAGLAQTPNYRYADLIGDRLFVAGQVPRSSADELIGRGDPIAQARACLENLDLVVRHHGFDRADIHQLTIYVVGPREHLTAAWSAVTAHFDDDVPPATLLGVTVLGYADQLVEIDAVVQRG